MSEVIIRCYLYVEGIVILGYLGWGCMVELGVVVFLEWIFYIMLEIDEWGCVIV